MANCLVIEITKIRIFVKILQPRFVGLSIDHVETKQSWQALISLIVEINRTRRLRDLNQEKYQGKEALQQLASQKAAKIAVCKLSALRSGQYLRRNFQHATGYNQ